jgi:hypothetical protein
MMEIYPLELARSHPIEFQRKALYGEVSTGGTLL